MTTVYERCTEWGMTPQSRINELEAQVKALTAVEIHPEYSFLPNEPVTVLSQWSSYVKRVGYWEPTGETLYYVTWEGGSGYLPARCLSKREEVKPGIEIKPKATRKRTEK